MLGRHKDAVARISDPIARVLLRARVRPNQLTVLGLVTSMVSAAAFAAGHLRSGGLLLIVAGALDILDGALARASGRVSAFGAFLDSVLDRYSDLLVLSGIVLLFMQQGSRGAVAAALAAVIGTVMVSYTRARAESVGVECRVGLLERGERLLVLIVGALLDLLAPAVWVVAAGANLTAIHRIAHTRQATQRPATGAAAVTARPSSGAAPAPRTAEAPGLEAGGQPEPSALGATAGPHPAAPRSLPG
jgi:CDP-diacylglycerol--glycerol-3-phosphate 3-phosphatidyltransferase